MRRIALTLALTSGLAAPAGAGDLILGAESDLRFDDNVYGTSIGEIADGYWTIAPTIESTQTWKTLTAELNAPTHLRAVLGREQTRRVQLRRRRRPHLEAHRANDGGVLRRFPALSEPARSRHRRRRARRAGVLQPEFRGVQPLASHEPEGDVLSQRLAHALGVRGRHSHRSAEWSRLASLRPPDQRANASRRNAAVLAAEALSVERPHAPHRLLQRLGDDPAMCRRRPSCSRRRSARRSCSSRSRPTRSRAVCSEAT